MIGSIVYVQSATTFNNFRGRSFTNFFSENKYSTACFIIPGRCRIIDQHFFPILFSCIYFVSKYLGTHCVYTDHTSY